jgi:hypothetical protein
VTLGLGPLHCTLGLGFGLGSHGQIAVRFNRDSNQIPILSTLATQFGYQRFKTKSPVSRVQRFNLNINKSMRFTGEVSNKLLHITQFIVILRPTSHPVGTIFLRVGGGRRKSVTRNFPSFTCQIPFRTQGTSWIVGLIHT